MFSRLWSFLRRLRFCRSPRGLPAGTIVIFPIRPGFVACGLAGIVEVVRAGGGTKPDLGPAERAAAKLAAAGLLAGGPADRYAGGAAAVTAIEEAVAALRRPDAFPALFADEDLRGRTAALAETIGAFVDAEGRILDSGEAAPDPEAQETVNGVLVRLKDAAWAFRSELLVNVERVRALLPDGAATPKAIREYRKANLILNSIDRLEIRGRDSAGILFQVSFPDPAALAGALSGHDAEVERRKALLDLPACALQIADDGRTATFVYKVAAEVGKLGDNVAELRRQISEDPLLFHFLAHPSSHVLVMAHTRWASNGIINIPNCHPLDNQQAGESAPPEVERGPFDGRAPRIHVALNGDVDNYLELKARYEERTGRQTSERITTDAKVISLWVDHYLRQGDDLSEAFRKAVTDFTGSAAITMCSDLEPGRLYLSLKGSGQSLYVGLASGGYVVASEIYGLVEETNRFVKLEGERERVPGDEKTRGQMFVLDPNGPGEVQAIRAFCHDGTPVEFGEASVRRAEITTRDVDRGDFPHFFLKEVSQASSSIAKTLRGKFTKEGELRMGADTIPAATARALADRRLERIVVVGQGTASIAAMAISAFFHDSLRGSGMKIESMKASELSGFWLEPDMSKTLVVAVTQSGATADTNRAVDLARERGAHTIAIVNRRNSDVTFKTAGVLYTSDGRDVEMSVASTKAFYSQVVAGALLGLAFGGIAGTLSGSRVREHLTELRKLPELLDQVFAKSEQIAAAAERLAPTRRYWAVVGSGPNRIAAEEVRIKLSELCYKSISADSVEDKKHIDLSAEPLILVLAAGNHDSVLSDLAKDVAIFKAHRGIPVVFATEGDRRFDPYAAEVIGLPKASPLLSMILATMGGHLFGYHAAQAIDEGGRFLGRIRQVVVGSLERPASGAVREIGRFAREVRERLRKQRFASALEAETAADLVLLLKYAAGEIPPVSFEDEFGRPPGSSEIHSALVETLRLAIDQTIRPVDAIKHQAKIVTVGTSRPSERPTGPIFDVLAEAGVNLSAITFADRALLTEIQTAVEGVAGLTRYQVSGLAADGSPADGATIKAVERTGAAAGIPSRADRGAPLKGTKRSVVQERKAFVGVGAKDGKRIAIIPIVDHRFAVQALVLLHLTFKGDLPVEEKVKALGARYDAVVNGVTEADVQWTDDLLAPIPPADLVTTTPAQLARRILG